MCARFTLPAPRMCAGLYGTNGLGRADAAVPKIVRSNEYACARIVSRPGANSS